MTKGKRNKEKEKKENIKEEAREIALFKVNYSLTLTEDEVNILLDEPKHVVARKLRKYAADAIVAAAMKIRAKEEERKLKEKEDNSKDKIEGKTNET